MASPTIFGKYMLLERINIGGMAEVFKAKAFGIQGFERVLAVKRILPNMAEDEEFINMFIDEARIAVQLSHPNVVSIFELGKYDGQYYIAMEYVPGKDLRQILDRFRKRQATLPIPAAAYLVAKICEGLDYAHRKTDPSGRPLNVIHRDVSPQNILVSYEGAVKITDFGIVKAEDRASKTQVGVLKGKFGYMSPEQVRGLEIDRRSDIFAVGILLYEALTGKRLFIGESDFATLEKVRNAEVPKPSEYKPEINAALEQVVLKTLARERDERYAWAMDLHNDLQRFLIDGETIFNAQRLGTMLRQEYQSDIDEEMQKMEQYKQLPVPATLLSQAVEIGALPSGERDDNRAEKTMIFESDFNVASAEPSALVRAEQNTQLVEAPPEPVPTLETAVPAAAAIEPPATRRPRRWTRWAVVVAFVLLSVALTYLLLDNARAVGTLIVTSAPTEKVEISLDGRLIGKKTPLYYANVAVGEHTLVLRSPGYQTKTYRFELIQGAPAEIQVELERQTAASPSLPTQAASPNTPLAPADKRDATSAKGELPTLEITSEPPGVTVRLGGAPQGVTPYTMHVQDTTHPVVLEMVKTGYISQIITTDVVANEPHKTLHVKLVAALGTTPATANALPLATAPLDLPHGMVPGKLIIHSKPEDCSIYLNGTNYGTAPRDIPNLDPRQSYTLELIKEGYKPYQEKISFYGHTAIAVAPTLQPEKRRSKGVAALAAASPQACSGSGGKISIMPVGIADCKVSIGHVSLGIAPVFKKDCPVGKCSIEVQCPDGKHYQTSKLLKTGHEEKIIIKAADWQASP